MRSRITAAALCLLFTAPAAAQRTCRAENVVEGELISERRWAFDGEGRVSTYHQTLHPAAWSELTRYRYGARGDRIEQRTRLDEGPDPAEYGWHPAFPLITERTADAVIERAPAAAGRPERTVTWWLDARGRVTSAREAPSDEGADAWSCVYDLAGRPIYMGLHRDGREHGSTWWRWDGGRLVGVVRETSQGDELTYVVRHPRRGRIEIASTDGGELDRWAGRCDQVLYDRCAPVLGPARRDGSRPRVPRADGRPQRPVASVRPARAFDPALLGAPLTLAGLRAAYGGRAVRTSVSFFENAPDMAYPILCVAGRASECATVIRHDERGRATGVVTRDPDLDGPHGIRVGAAGRDVASHLEGCAIQRGLVEGIACRVRGRPTVEAWFDVPPDTMRAASPRPGPAVIATHAIAWLEWHPRPTERDPDQ